MPTGKTKNKAVIDEEHRIIVSFAKQRYRMWRKTTLILDRLLNDSFIDRDIGGDEGSGWQRHR